MQKAMEETANGYGDTDDLCLDKQTGAINARTFLNVQSKQQQKAHFMVTCYNHFLFFSALGYSFFVSFDMHTLCVFFCSFSLDFLAFPIHF